MLTACADAGLVRRIEPAGSPARYETRAGDNHHHVVCRSCGRTDDVDCVVGARPCLTPRDDAGYAIDEAEIVFWGLCPRCRADGPPPLEASQLHDVSQETTPGTRPSSDTGPSAPGAEAPVLVQPVRAHKER